MRTNPAGVGLIRRFEGLRLQAYEDSAGVWTVGYGSTRGVVPGMVITRQQAEDRLIQDIRDAERTIERALSVPVNDNQYSSLVSWTFNVGVGAMQRSTLMRKINRGDLQGAAEQFLRWVWATDAATGKKVKQPGLIRRREAERALFLTSTTAQGGAYGTSTTTA